MSDLPFLDRDGMEHICMDASTQKHTPEFLVGFVVFIVMRRQVISDL